MTSVNYEVLQPNNGTIVKAWIKGVPIEDEAKAQLYNVASMPFVYKWVAAMPDVHWGMGATVGSVIATERAIIPAAVGVDIGCGMIAVQTNLTANDLPDSLSELRAAIEKRIPHGRTNNGGPGDRGAWGRIPMFINAVWEDKGGLFDRLCAIAEKHPKMPGRTDVEHLGTLGTGNHFIEVCLDENDNVWIMLHSGSRGIGNRIGTYFIEQAKNEMKRWHINLPDQDLAYLPEGTSLFDDYVEAVGWAQDYARTNRNIMLATVEQAIRETLKKNVGRVDQAINCHHNYVDREHHFGKNVLVTRKGAVRARKGDLGIIPGSMGARSYIVAGLGNPDSFMSCSHGAGRKMSRNEARKRFTLAQHIEATEGVECRKDDGVLDETPGAYKDIDTVMAAQSDLVDVVHTLRQVICVKG